MGKCMWPSLEKGVLHVHCKHVKKNGILHVVRKPMEWAFVWCTLHFPPISILLVSQTLPILKKTGILLSSLSDCIQTCTNLDKIYPLIPSIQLNSTWTGRVIISWKQNLHFFHTIWLQYISSCIVSDQGHFIPKQVTFRLLFMPENKCNYIKVIQDRKPTERIQVLIHMYSSGVFGSIKAQDDSSVSNHQMNLGQATRPGLAVFIDAFSVNTASGSSGKGVLPESVDFWR